jgi:hypothetical protein
MPRKDESGEETLQLNKPGPLQRAASSIARIFGRGGAQPKPRAAMSDERTLRTTAPHHPRREPDIPFDRIEQAYTPNQTSLKAPFRASGADRQRDQEFSAGVADERWNDEDRFTNKSGDPRIGTHGRTYEPGEDK